MHKYPPHPTDPASQSENAKSKNVQDSEVAAYFKALDESADGKVSKEEFLARAGAIYVGKQQQALAMQKQLRGE